MEEKTKETILIILIIIIGTIMAFVTKEIFIGISISIILIILAAAYLGSKEYKEEVENESNKVEDEVIDNISKINENKKEIKGKTQIVVFDFKVKGITFEGRTEKLKSIIKKGCEKGYLEKYEGCEDEAIIETGVSIGEFHGQLLGAVKLEKAKYQNKDAVKVFISNWENDFVHIGNIPSDKIDNIIKYLDDDVYELEILATIVGGNFKNVDIDDKIYIEKLNYGVSLNITVYKK